MHPHTSQLNERGQPFEVLEVTFLSKRTHRNTQGHNAPGTVSFMVS